jgi:hypothetical protein
MLDHVERRRFLVKPTREGSLPRLVRLANVELDERAGQLLLFPWSGLLARAKADDRVLPAHRLAGAESDVLDDAVALVEDPENRNALGHRGYPALPRRGHRHVFGHRSRRVALLSALAARGERERHQ